MDSARTGWRLLEYLVVRHRAFQLSLVGLLLLSWFFVTSYWLDDLASRAPWLEHAFLLLSLGWTLLWLAGAWSGMRRLVPPEAPRARLPPETSSAPWVWALRCRMLAARATRGWRAQLARRRLEWIALALESLRPADARLTLRELPGAWRRRPSYAIAWMALAALIGLLTAGSAWTGETLARLTGQLEPGRPYLLAAESCRAAAADAACTPLDVQRLPGGTVRVSGQLAGPTGVLRLSFATWPRCRLLLALGDAAGVLFGPQGRSDFQADLLGRRAEVRYALDAGNSGLVRADFRLLAPAADALEKGMLVLTLARTPDSAVRR